MLNKRKENLLRSIPWLEEASVAKYKAAQKKQQLLTMAKKGEPRPIAGKHPLGQVLGFYTNPKTDCYDLVFDKEIRELAPEWFISLSDIANEKKQQLLEMAKNGEPRPNQRTHPLGSALSTYTCQKSQTYNLVFDKEIRELRPDWFARYDSAVQRKNKLLEMARNGEPRPHHKNYPLGECLYSYTNLKSSSYDPVFDKKIRELAPHWFFTQYDVANQKKEQLLEMAKKGEGRPNQKTHSLGRVLCFYTNPKSDCYDPIFDKEIRELAPKWFTIAQKHGKIKYPNSGKQLSSKLREKNVGCKSAK